MLVFLRDFFRPEANLPKATFLLSAVNLYPPPQLESQYEALPRHQEERKKIENVGELKKTDDLSKIDNIGGGKGVYWVYKNPN